MFPHYSGQPKRSTPNRAEPQYSTPGRWLLLVALTGAITASGALVRARLKDVAGSLTGSGAVTSSRLAIISLTGSITAAGSTLSKSVAKTLAGSITAAGALVKAARIALAGSLTGAGSATKMLPRSLAGSITATGAVQWLRVAYANLAGSITASSTLSKSVAKTLAGSITAAGSAAKRVAKALAGSITGVGTQGRGFTKLLSGAITAIGALTKVSNTLLPQPPITNEEEEEIDVLIGGTSRWQQLISSSLRWTEYEGGQVGSMSLEIEDTDDDITLSEWQEVTVVYNSITVWGGYIVRLQPNLTNGGNRRWTVQCESYETLLNRTAIVRKTYINQTPAEILADLFTEAGLDGEFDTSTEVDATLSALASFSASGEKLTDLLDRLALLAGVSWSINQGKQVVFKADGDLTAAPFAIKTITEADYSTSYPPSGTPTPDINATDIRNRVTVYGGQIPSATQTGNFTGDGTTTQFTLAHAPIHDILKVTLDGVIQWHGYDFYDTNFNDYDCLVDYTLGTVRWLAAPAVGAAIVVEYRYAQQLLVTRSSAASYAQYGRYFDYELRDSSLTTEASCIAAAEAVLGEYAFGTVGASLEVEWFGPRAGQQIQIEFPTLSLTGFYPIRQASIEIARKTKLALVALKVGGRGQRLSRVVGSSTSSGSMIGPSMPFLPTKPDANISGETGLLRLRSRIEIIDPLTTFISEDDYGDASGLVMLFDTNDQLGKLLALDGGVVKTELSASGIEAVAGSVGGWDVETSYLVKDTGLAATSAGLAPSDYPFYAGATYANRASAPFRVTPAGALFASAGRIAEWFLLSGLMYYGSGSSRAGMDPGNGYPFFAGSETPSAAPFRVTDTGGLFASNADITGAIKASSGYISGSLYVGTVNQRIHIDGANKLIESEGFSAGVSGFRLTGTSGDAEFNNVTARGAITTAVFNKSLVTAFAGSQIVSKSASKLYADLTISGSMTLDVDLQDGGAPFANGDIVRIKDGTSDVWATVNTGSSQTTYWRYTATRQSGSSSGTIRAGYAVVDYGQSGDGYVMLSADGSNRPWASIVTHAGAPWTTLTEKARLGNLTGISGASGYGLWTDNGYFTGTVNASAGSIDGFLTLGTSGGIYQGSGTAASPTTGLKIWNDGSTGRIAGYNSGTVQWYANTDGKLYAGAGKVRIDGDGINFLGASSSPDGATLTWKSADGLTTWGSTWAYATQMVSRHQSATWAINALIADYTGSGGTGAKTVAMALQATSGAASWSVDFGDSSFPLSANASEIAHTYQVRASTLNGNILALTDGVSAPSTASGYALIYVDTSDGDLKVKFGDGTVKTIVTDS